ncbi:MAG: hypothetical protein ACI97A_000419 [Planctomycetota bacterium]|jgi:hypothetical protein
MKQVVDPESVMQLTFRRLEPEPDICRVVRHSSAAVHQVFDS